MNAPIITKILLAALTSTLIVGCGSSAREAGALAHFQFDFHDIQENVAKHKVGGEISRLTSKHPETDAVRLAMAIGRAEDVVKRDPDQLWFQLQARTRIEGWEAIQKQLLEQRPDETLIALTSRLDPVRAGVIRSVHVEGKTTHLAISRGGKHVYCGTHKAFSIRDAGTLETIRRYPNVGIVRSTLTDWQGKDYFLSGRNGRLAAHDVATGIVQFEVRTEDNGRRSARGHRFPPAIVRVPGEERFVRFIGKGALTFLDGDIRFPNKPAQFRDGVALMAFRDSGKQLLVGDSRGVLHFFQFPKRTQTDTFQVPWDKDTFLNGYALSNDGARLACALDVREGAARRGEFVVVDLNRRRILSRARSQPDAFSAIAFCRDNKHVLTGSASGEVSRWRNGRLVGQATSHASAITALLAAPEEDFAMAGDETGFLKVVDTSRIHPPPKPLPRRAAFAARNASKSAASTWRVTRRFGRLPTGVESLIVIDQGNSKQRLYEKQVTIEMENKHGRLISFACDEGKRLLLLGWQEASIAWDLETDAQTIVPIDVSDVPGLPSDKNGKRRILPVNIHPNGKYAVVWTPDAFALFDPANGEKLLVARHDLGAAAMPEHHHWKTWEIQDNKMAVASMRNNDSSWRREATTVFDMRSGERVADIYHGMQQSRIPIFSPSTGVVVISGLDRRRGSNTSPSFVIWNLNEPSPPLSSVVVHEGKCLPSAEHPDRLLTYRAPAVIDIWDTTTGKKLGEYDLQLSVARNGGTPSMRFDGRILKVTEGDGKLVHEFEYYRKSR